MLYAGHHKARLGQRHQLGQAEVHVLLPPGGALDVHHQGIAQRRACPRPQPVGEEQLQVQGPLLTPDVLHVPDIDNLPALAAVGEQGAHPRQNGGVAGHGLSIFCHTAFLLNQFLYFSIARFPWPGNPSRALPEGKAALEEEREIPWHCRGIFRAFLRI